MFISLFNTLKATGVPCTLRELLDLIGCVEKELAFANMEDFYFLSRATLVKDEKHYDKFFSCNSFPWQGYLLTVDGSKKKHFRFFLVL